MFWSTIDGMTATAQRRDEHVLKITMDDGAPWASTDADSHPLIVVDRDEREQIIAVLLISAPLIADARRDGVAAALRAMHTRTDTAVRGEPPLQRARRRAHTRALIAWADTHTAALDRAVSALPWSQDVATRPSVTVATPTV